MDKLTKHLKETWSRLDESASDITMEILGGEAHFTAPNGNTASVGLKMGREGSFDQAALELDYGVTGAELEKMFFDYMGG